MKDHLKGSRGSTLVEAAIVFPLVILICAAVIMTGLKMYSHVIDDASEHRSEADTKREITVEDILRGKWTLSHNENDEEENKDRQYPE